MPTITEIEDAGRVFEARMKKAEIELGLMTQFKDYCDRDPVAQKIVAANPDATFGDLVSDELFEQFCRNLGMTTNEVVQFRDPTDEEYAGALLVMREVAREAGDAIPGNPFGSEN